MIISPILTLALIGLLSLLCQWLAHRLNLPAILPLLITGLVLGPGTGALSPDVLLGPLLFPLVSLAVAIILFEGSLTLRFVNLEGQNRVILYLVSLGMLVTFVISALAARYILGLSPEVSALLGALVVVTGPTVIAPLLRSIRLHTRLSTVLMWEGILIDPIGALLAVVVYEYISVSQIAAFEHSISTFAFTVATGTLFGILTGWLMALALRKHLFPHYLQNVAVLTLMLAAFALSNELAHESGLLTVTVMGIWLANSKNVELDGIIEFKETLSTLLISALFILLAARIDSRMVHYLNGATFAWLAVVLLIARPLAVWLCTMATTLHWKERLLLGWIAPRGIVAAAVSSLFALKLADSGLPDHHSLVPLVFLVIIVTVCQQSLLTGPLTRFLGLEAPDRNGCLIFGANPLARAVAEALARYQVPVLLSDTNWENLRQARMKGLSVYYGNPTSEHADNQMDLSLIRRLLVLSPYQRLNTEVAYHYQDHFGYKSVYKLPEPTRDQKPREQGAERHQRLFGDEAYYGRLSSWLATGAQIKGTKLTDTFDWPSYLAQHGQGCVPLFAFSDRGRLRTFTAEAPFTPGPGWEVIALIKTPAGNGGRESSKDA